MGWGLAPRAADTLACGGGMVGLGDLPGDSFSSVAQAISADGSVIVGQGVSASGREAFRWTAEGGMIGLGDLPGSLSISSAIGVSGDGSVIVGSASAGDPTTPLAVQPFIWDQTNGMRALDQVLIDLGIDLTGWTLDEVRGISADGSTIVGVGTHTGFGTEGWVAVIPEPSTALLLGMGFVALGLRSRARRCLQGVATTAPATE